jgi:dipeptidyl aminopeptidase/acylaminoacyl peptidase
MTRTIAARRRRNEHYASVSRCAPAAFFIALVAAFLFALATASPARAQAKRIELSDLRKLVSVSDPQISPDGKSIVCVVSHMNFEQDRHDAELMLIDIATGSQRPLTLERKRVGSPRWSPAGDRLAFLAAAPTGKDEQEQVFILPMNGGDAVRLTDAPNGIQQFAWRPNGQEIAYVTAEEPANKKEIEAHNDAFEVGDDDFLSKAAPTSSHVWLISSEGGKPRQLTSGSWSLPRSAPPSSPASPPCPGRRRR